MDLPYEDYRHYIFGYISKKSNHLESKENIEEIYRDGIVELTLNMLAKKFKEGGSVKHYLFGICRYLWIAKVKKQKKMQAFSIVALRDDLDLPDYQTPEEILFLKDEEVKKQIATLLDKLNQKCRKLISLWMNNTPMEKIAKALALSNTNVAKTTKYRCIEKLKKLTKELGWKPK